MRAIVVPPETIAEFENYNGKTWLNLFKCFLGEIELRMHRARGGL